jgi:hypothetical protein
MTARRSLILAGVGLIAFCWVSSLARADLGSLFRNLQFAGNRNFSQDPQSGPLFDNNIYKQGVVHNRLGQGWTYESFRFFGPDSWDNPSTFDFGPLKIDLGHDPTIVQNPQPVGIHNKVGFTTTLIPDVFFESKTGQRSFDVFSGQTNFTSAPINYNITFNTGLQNYNWSGNMLINSKGDINALGFYNLDLQLTNVGNATADGVILHDEAVTDFGLGNVHVSGNLLADAIASGFQATGNSLFTVPPRVASGATKDKKTDELMARLNSGEKLSDGDMQYLVQQMILTAFQNDPIGFLTNGMPSTVPGFEGLNLNQSQTTDPAAIAAANADPNLQSSDSTISGATVPEPGTLLLLAAGAWAAGTLRRRAALSN